MLMGKIFDNKSRHRRPGIFLKQQTMPQTQTDINVKFRLLII